VRLVVCVKQVEEAVFLGRDSRLAPLSRGYPNPADLAAVEHALSLRGDAGEIVALTVGPPNAEVALRKAMMMGVERAVRVWSDQLAGADSFAVATVLAGAARRLGFDLMLLGARSADTGTEAVGAAVAELLGLPLVTRVVGIERVSDGSRLLAHRKLAKDERETHRVPCPAIVTIEAGVTEPRYCAPGWVGRLRRGRVEPLRPEAVGIEVDAAERRLAVLEVTPPRPRTKVGVPVAGLSLNEKLALMRGGRKQPLAQDRVIEGPPPQVARRLKTALERFLASRP
jgi:electron transfer flavoprotein alpha/beta subunit